MSKLFALVTVAVFLPMLMAAPAEAAKKRICQNPGYCAPGTCAQDGSNLACNPKNCAKANCRT